MSLIQNGKTVIAYCQHKDSNQDTGAEIKLDTREQINWASHCPRGRVVTPSTPPHAPHAPRAPVFALNNTLGCKQSHGTAFYFGRNKILFGVSIERISDKLLMNAFFAVL